MTKTLLFLFLVNCLCVSGQTIDSLWLSQHYSKQEEEIAMRDDKKLYTVIYAPLDKTEKHPILMVRTPYSVAPYGKGRFSPRLYSTHWANYIREGYVIVMQDVRGRYMSEGEFVDVRPYIADKKTKNDIDESSDAYDTIDWLIKHVQDNNGRVGVFGISYPGFYSTMAALSGHPALKAVSPQAPVTDWFMGDDFHHNGAFCLMDAFYFYYIFGQPRPKPTTVAEKPFEFPGRDNYDFYLEQGPLRNYRKYMGDSIRFWNDLMSHPVYDAWWQARDARRACFNVKPATLVVGGTFDAEDCFGAWNLYKAIEAQSPQTDNKLVMGPWFHGGWSRSSGASLGNIRFGSNTSQYFQEKIELPFFNYYLKDKGTDQLPEATVFFSGENNWKSFDSWPPKKQTPTPIYLRENQTLSFEKPTAELSASVYNSDPNKPVPYTESVHLLRSREYMTDDQRFAARRPDVVVFETPPLEEDLCLAGPVVTDLKVMVAGSDADFVVKLIDVFPDNFSYDSSYCCKGVKSEAEMAGYQMLVRGDIMRGKFRNSFENPEPFFGRVEPIKFSMPDVAHTFKKGHRLMIQIQSSWFPLFDRNPQQFVDIYKCNEQNYVPARIRIFHQANDASSIILPILKE